MQNFEQQAAENTANKFCNEKEHVAIEDYIEQEVGGLRADWERDRKEQNRRLEKLEDE